MTRFLDGPVVAMFLAAACALTAYVLVTGAQTRRSAALTERDQGGVGVPAGRQQAEHGREAPAADAASRSVNVAYHHRSYPVDFRHRWILEKAHRLRMNTKLKAEHAHVQRLLRELRHVRYVQAHRAEKGGRPDAVAVGTNSPGITASSLSVWRAKQIAAAETIGREADTAGTDPWPNCPDPYDHTGATWDDTVQCENSGSWLDSPGYYRCGLQLDPRWEQRFGRMCP